jgi:hypothetical protein
MHTGFWSENLKEKALERSRCKWHDNIRTDLREIGWEDVDWLHLAKDSDQQWALLNMVMNVRVP